MITLLPYQTREKLRLAKRNATLIKYIIVLAFVGLFLGVYYIGMKFQINNIKTSSEQQINYAAQKDHSRIEREDAVKAQEASIQSALNLAQKDLSHPSYFKLLTAFSSSLPDGVIVKELDFSNVAMERPVEIQLFATSSDIASSIKNGFDQHKNIFTKVSVESIKSIPSEEDKLNSKYPISAVLNLTINVGALK